MKWLSLSIIPNVLSALTLLVGWQEGHPTCKNWVVRYWHGYLSGARCTWFAYGSARPLSCQNWPVSIALFPVSVFVEQWLTKCDIVIFMRSSKGSKGFKLIVTNSADQMLVKCDEPDHDELSPYRCWAGPDSRPIVMLIYCILPYVTWTYVVWTYACVTENILCSISWLKFIKYSEI